MKIEKYGKVVIEPGRITISDWTLDGEWEPPVNLTDIALDWALLRIAEHRTPVANHITFSYNDVGPHDFAPDGPPTSTREENLVVVHTYGECRCGVRHDTYPLSVPPPTSTREESP